RASWRRGFLETSTATAYRGIRCCLAGLPFFRRVGVQRHCMDLAHQQAERGVHRLMAAHRRKTSEAIAHDHGLVMGFQSTMVLVAFVLHGKVQWLQRSECSLDAFELGGHGSI